MNAVRRVWITRAEPGASRTAARLTQLGFEPVVAPLLRIETLSPAIPEGAPDALIFTSVNAVTVWSALGPARDVPVVAVGDATAEAARAAGFRAVRSARGDLEALADLIRADPALKGAGLLHPGAETLAGDLQGLVGGHVRIDALPVYRAVPTDAGAPDVFDAVLLHSSRAAGRLAALPPEAARGRIACAISAAAAAPLTTRPFAEIRIADRPDEADLLACLGKPPAAV